MIAENTKMFGNNLQNKFVLFLRLSASELSANVRQKSDSCLYGLKLRIVLKTFKNSICIECIKTFI